MSVTEEKNQGAVMVTLGVVGEGCHRADRKVPFMPKTEGESSGQQDPVGSWL